MNGSGVTSAPAPTRAAELTAILLDPAIRADAEPPIFLAMAAMLGAAVALPQAFGDHALAHRGGRGWHDVRAEGTNARLKELAGDELSAKDLRTWNATVLAAVAAPTWAYCLLTVTQSRPAVRVNQTTGQIYYRRSRKRKRLFAHNRGFAGS